MVGNQNNPAQPPRAPSAPSVRSTTGGQQQGRNNSFRKGPNNNGGVSPGGRPNKGPNNNGGVRPGDKGGQGRFGGGRQTPYQKQQERERKKRERERRQNQQQNQQPRPKPAPSPVYAEKIDPRDEQYWEHRTALENSFFVQTQQLDLQQQQADSSFALESAQMSEYNRRRQESIAMSRLGRGLRSGGFREERTLNDMDYAADTFRRESDKAAADRGRILEKGGLQSQLTSDIQQLEREGAGRQAELMLNESETSAGDRQNLEPQFRAEDNRRAIRQTTSRIKALREKQKNAGPNEKAKIEKRIKKLQRRRTRIKGRL
jgi:hypothetical protein